MTLEAQTGLEVDASSGVPVIGARLTPVAVVVHACHERTIDVALGELAVPGLDRDALEPLLTYCAELRCEADRATCPGCKRRTEAEGIHSLDEFIARHEEIVVGEGTVRLLGQGEGTLHTPALAALEKTWSGENYWFSPIASLNQEAEDRAKVLSASEVEAEIITLLRGEEKHKGTGFLRVHGAPDDPLGIEDAYEAALVLLPPSAWQRAPPAGAKRQRPFAPAAAAAAGRPVARPDRRAWRADRGTPRASPAPLGSSRPH